jgi:hypothetical protein
MTTTTQGRQAGHQISPRTPACLEATTTSSPVIGAGGPPRSSVALSVTYVQVTTTSEELRRVLARVHRILFGTDSTPATDGAVTGGHGRGGYCHGGPNTTAANPST